ncbi:MAG TPA: addiction module protein [Longimicrobium sp.]
MSIDEFVAAALELPAEDFEEVIARLNAHRSRTATIRQAWIDEADRRMELVRAGKMRVLDVDEVLADPDFDD